MDSSWRTRRSSSLLPVTNLVVVAMVSAAARLVSVKQLTIKLVTVVVVVKRNPFKVENSRLLNYLRLLLLLNDNRLNDNILFNYLLLNQMNSNGLFQTLV